MGKARQLFKGRLKAQLRKCQQDALVLADNLIFALTIDRIKFSNSCLGLPLSNRDWKVVFLEMISSGSDNHN